MAPKPIKRMEVTYADGTQEVLHGIGRINIHRSSSKTGGEWQEAVATIRIEEPE